MPGTVSPDEIVGTLICLFGLVVNLWVLCQYIVDGEIASQLHENGRRKKLACMRIGIHVLLVLAQASLLLAFVPRLTTVRPPLPFWTLVANYGPLFASVFVAATGVLVLVARRQIVQMSRDGQ